MVPAEEHTGPVHRGKDPFELVLDPDDSHPRIASSPAEGWVVVGGVAPARERAPVDRKD